jgi:hypothetical protein
LAELISFLITSPQNEIIKAAEVLNGSMDSDIAGWHKT